MRIASITDCKMCKIYLNFDFMILFEFLLVDVGWFSNGIDGCGVGLTVVGLACQWILCCVWWMLLLALF